MSGCRWAPWWPLLAVAITATAHAAPGAGSIAALPAVEPCGAQAARYEDGKSFTFSVIRAGEVRIANPLRPLTPEVTQVLEVVIGGKRAIAYGPDFLSLRRGGSPGAMQNALGAPIRWDTALPALPSSLGIVAEDGTALADLTFKTCEAPPVAAPEPAPVAGKKGAQPRGKAAGKPDNKTDKTTGKVEAGTDAAKPRGKPPAKASASKAPAKAPGGPSLPQGAIPE